MRRDIQALRAFAVGAVVIYHLWPDALPGGFIGVDVFFVISGFLITGHLLRRTPRTWGDLAGFWLRRVRRLLPAAFTVIAVSLVGTFLFAPDAYLSRFIQEILTATVYVLNWDLAANSIDYLAADDPASPVQHYWSLSIEEQFYLLWPVIFLLLGLWARRRRRGSWVPYLVGVGGMFVASFAYSLWATWATPQAAYFVSPTRFWQLAAGGLVALAFHVRPDLAGRVPSALRSALAWLGFGGIVAGSLLLDGAMPFPGFAALVPVTSAALVILADAEAAPRTSPTRVFGVRPVQWIGDTSYSIYLWHWPLIVLVPYALGHERTLPESCAILAATLLLAWFSKRQIEDRFRNPRPGRTGMRTPYLVTLAGTAAVVLACVGSFGVVSATQGTARAEAAQLTASAGECYGASAALLPECGGDAALEAETLPVAPALVDAADDRPTVFGDNCLTYPPFGATKTCEYGDPDGDVEVAVVGNSHAAHWMSALDALGKEEGWHITTYVASQCTVSTTPARFPSQEYQDGCIDWAQRALEATKGSAFDLVITSERSWTLPSAVDPDDSYPSWLDGYRDTLGEWLDAGTNVVVIKDTPDPGTTVPFSSVPTCLSVNQDDLAACSGDRSDWDRDDPLYDVAGEAIDADADATVRRLDMNDAMCTDDRCYGVVGGTVVYYDASHMTETFSETLTPYLRDRLVSLAAELGVAS